MFMAHKVLKPISSANGVIPSGTIIDASGWKNVASLVAGRFLVEVISSGVVSQDVSIVMPNVAVTPSKSHPSMKTASKRTLTA